MDKNKVKMFVKEHKKELIAGAGMVVGAVMCVIAGKSIRVSKVVACTVIGNNIKDVPVPDGFSVGKVMELFEDGDEFIAIARNLTVNDLGKFGEELVKHGLVANGAESAITAEFLRNM